MDELLLKTIVEKADAHEKKISELQGVLRNAYSHEEEVRVIKNEVEELKITLKNSYFPIEAMQELSTRLAENARIVRQPVTNKVLHHHHVPKVIWITTGLFIAFALVCSGWYMTAGKLDEYKASDTKYRYLKLTSNISLRQLLYTTDSLHRVTNLRDSVLRQEEAIRERFELQRRIQEKENELIQLKKKRK